MAWYIIKAINTSGTIYYRFYSLTVIFLTLCAFIIFFFFVANYAFVVIIRHAFFTNFSAHGAAICDLKLSITKCTRRYTLRAFVIILFIAIRACFMNTT